jgi:hypothetical protein
MEGLISARSILWFIVLDKSNGRIDIGKVDPLVYCATIREYWRLGQKTGKGFDAGKQILQRLKD